MQKITLFKIGLLALIFVSAQHALAAVSAETAFTQMESQNRLKLIGKWHCRSEIAEYQIKTNTRDEYRADGTYRSESVTQIRQGERERQSSIHVEAGWSLKGNTIRLSQIQLKAVQSDDPAYAARLKEVFQKFDWAENQLLSLSGSSLAFLPVAPMASGMPIHCQKTMKDDPVLMLNQ